MTPYPADPLGVHGQANLQHVPRANREKI